MKSKEKDQFIKKSSKSSALNKEVGSDLKNKSINDSKILEFDNEKIDISFLPIITDSQKDDKTINEKNIREHIKEERSKTPEIAAAIIPTSILDEKLLTSFEFEDQHSLNSKTQLLNDLEMMGDSREIPLLNGFLVDQDYVNFKVEIEKLLERFSVDIIPSANTVKPLSNQTLKPFNVFEELFRNCDTEAKLILFDEIVAVGDIGDIVFLESLLEDKEAVIRQQAKEKLPELKAKLEMDENLKRNQTSTLEVPISELTKDEFSEYHELIHTLEITPSPEVSDIFDIGFDLEFEMNTSKEKDDASSDQLQQLSVSSIKKQWRSFSAKIIAIFSR